jgi:hypothetical protein
MNIAITSVITISQAHNAASSSGGGGGGGGWHSASKQRDSRAYIAAKRQKENQTETKSAQGKGTEMMSPKNRPRVWNDDDLNPWNLIR